jgi:hypothetical protein
MSMRGGFVGHFGRHGCNLQQSNHVYARSYGFKMVKKIEKSAACELQSVNRFLNARNMKPGDIHPELCEVHGEYAVSDLMVRRWVKHFNEGPENVHDDPRSGLPSVVNEDLVRAVEENIQKNRRVTIS